MRISPRNRNNIRKMDEEQIRRSQKDLQQL